MSQLPIDPDLSFEEAVRDISAWQHPGSMVGGPARNILVEVWGQLVGRSRALAEFDYFVHEAGSLTAAGKRLQAKKRTMERWRSTFEALPDDSAHKDELQGKTLGGWFLVRKLGSGGNGVVWLGRRDGVTAAIKILRRAKGAGLQRFRQEIAALRKLDGIAGVLPLLESFADTGIDADTPWLAMPRARPAREQLKEDTDPARVVECVRRVATALATAHELGVTHRDVKPENLFWRDESWEVGDFGLASFEGTASLTADLQKLGPIYYIAPEMLQQAGRSDGRAADVFSLAKTAWVLLTGMTYPIPGRLEQDHEVTRISTYFAGDVRSLEVLLHEATNLTPTDRPSMAEVSARLEAWLTATRGG